MLWSISQSGPLLIVFYENVLGSEEVAATWFMTALYTIYKFSGFVEWSPFREEGRQMSRLLLNKGEKPVFGTSTFFFFSTMAIMFYLIISSFTISSLWRYSISSSSLNEHSLLWHNPYFRNLSKIKMTEWKGTLDPYSKQQQTKQNLPITIRRWCEGESFLEYNHYNLCHRILLPQFYRDKYIVQTCAFHED